MRTRFFLPSNKYLSPELGWFSDKRPTGKLLQLPYIPRILCLDCDVLEIYPLWPSMQLKFLSMSHPTTRTIGHKQEGQMSRD